MKGPIVVDESKDDKDWFGLLIIELRKDGLDTGSNT